MRLPLESEAPLTRSYANLVGPADELLRYLDPNLTLLYASLSSAQRNQATNGGLALGRLSPQQLHLVRKSLYDDRPSLHYGIPEQTGNWSYTILSEPTERLPKGLPMDAKLTIDEKTDELLAFTSEIKVQGVFKMSRGLTAKEVAWHRFVQSRLDLFPTSRFKLDQTDLEHLRLGRQRSNRLTIRFAPDLWMELKLDDRDYETPEATPYAVLPASFKAQVEPLFQRYKARYGKLKPGQIRWLPGQEPLPLD